MKLLLKKLIQNYLERKNKALLQKRIRSYLENGQIPWSVGYHEYKKDQIIETFNDQQLINQIQSGILPENFGYRLDERIVEYAWLFANLQNTKTTFLDAGSTFNFDYLLKHPVIASKDLYIYTFHPENPSFPEYRVSYVYGDLRLLPFKDNFFQEIVCQSTLEHIDMDNSIYGYELKHLPSDKAQKNYEYMKAINELIRVLKPNGQILLTFPYGKFENHGFFQQLDAEMTERVFTIFRQSGTYTATFFQYLRTGWGFSNQMNCENSESYNPHTGLGKKDDYAAHSRSVCCIRFIKSQ